MARERRFRRLPRLPPWPRRKPQPRHLPDGARVQPPLMHLRGRTSRLLAIYIARCVKQCPPALKIAVFGSTKPGASPSTFAASKCSRALPAEYTSNPPSHTVGPLLSATAANSVTCSRHGRVAVAATGRCRRCSRCHRRSRRCRRCEGLHGGLVRRGHCLRVQLTVGPREAALGQTSRVSAWLACRQVRGRPVGSADKR